MGGNRLESLRLPPEATATLREVRERMRALAHGSSRNSLTGIPLESGVSVLVSGATEAERLAVAEALASDLSRDVLRIDLAAIVSKYVGETGKNLDRVFDMAEKAGGVLLFDEADALFGSRTDVKDSHDRYGNLDVGYLLQRIESYQGLVILATNMNTDTEAPYVDRFRYVVRLPLPGGDQ